MRDVDSILTSIFGLEHFRLQQREIVNDVLAGRDALVVMPTGAGKSLCYQLPAVSLRGLTLIISPLISLMTDQVRQMRALRIPAMMLCSGQSWDEQREVMVKVREGFRGLLYVAPERFSAPGFFSIITQRELSLLAIDEAHCISQWGHDFRPEYLRLGEVRKQLGEPLTIALTATATPEVRTDIVRNLELNRSCDPRNRLRPPEPQLSVDCVCQGEQQAGGADRLSFAPEGGRNRVLLHAQAGGASDLAAGEQAARTNGGGLSRRDGPGGARQQSKPLYRLRRCRSWWRPTPSAWASTSPTCAT